MLWLAAAGGVAGVCQPQVAFGQEAAGGRERRWGAGQRGVWSLRAHVCRFPNSLGLFHPRTGASCIALAPRIAACAQSEANQPCTAHSLPGLVLGRQCVHRARSAKTARVPGAKRPRGPGPCPPVQARGRPTDCLPTLSQTRTLPPRSDGTHCTHRFVPLLPFPAPHYLRGAQGLDSSLFRGTKPSALHQLLASLAVTVRWHPCPRHSHCHLYGEFLASSRSPASTSDIPKSPPAGCSPHVPNAVTHGSPTFQDNS